MAIDIYTELLHIIHPEQMLRCSGYVKLFKELKLLPVPLHRQKLNHRGFNQSDYIATFLSESYKLPIIHSLTRVINTPPQAHLRETNQRKKNIKGAFNLIEDVKDKNILLIDDVVTTGSTLREAAKTLKLHGATNVLAITLSGR
jgi:ComF family protein